MTVTNASFVSVALDQDPAVYRFGAEWRGFDPATALDCSELLEGVGRLLHVDPTIPDGSWLQYRHCHNHGTVIGIGRALETRGALLFKFRGDPLTGGRPAAAHVALSLGDDERTFEARSTAAGVGIFAGAPGRGWTHAALIPGLTYVAGDPSDWAAADWARAIDLGITNGARPHDFATREETVIMAMRAAERL